MTGRRRRPPAPMQEPNPPVVYRHPVRVYWEDTDAGGIVFYANYLKFFERARTEWLRALGFSQQRLQAEQDVIFVVVETALHHLRPARLDDLLEATVAVAEAARASLRLRQQVWRGHELLAEGMVRLGCVHAGEDRGANFKPGRIPAAILEKIQTR